MNTDEPQLPEPQSEPSQAFRAAEGETMLQLAQTMKALVDSPAYGSATNPSWWKRIFG
jgi:hypothetical protein